MKKQMILITKKIMIGMFVGIIFLLGIGEECVATENRLYKNEYSISAKKIVIDAKNGDNITKKINNALLEARDNATDTSPITVVLSKGKYKINNTLHIYSNTILDLNGSTLQYSGKKSHNMILSGTNGVYKGQDDYNSSSLCAKYQGFENIIIRNGIFESIETNTSCIMRIAHATNVTLEKITLSGGGCKHQAEIAAIDGFYVKDCTFENLRKDGTDTTNKTKMEALQLDIPCATSVYKKFYLDGTPMRNVEITGCTFRNVPRGVGTHTSLLGAYHENIKICNNRFENVLEEAIVGLNYYNCEIKGNTISNCGAGILFQNFKRAENLSSVYTTIFDGEKNYDGNFRNDLKSVITGNIIEIKYAPTCSETQGIKVDGRNIPSGYKGGDGKLIPAGEYYVSGVKVENNSIKGTAGFGIHMITAKDCVVNNNYIKQLSVSKKDMDNNKYDGICIELNSDRIAVTNNRIYDMVRNGIFVQEQSYVSKMENNTIEGCEQRGINFYLDSGCRESIKGNKIKSCKKGGILLSTGSTSKDIADNIISDLSGDAGITIYNKSTVGKIKNNIVTNVGKDINGAYCHGIKVTAGSECKTISKNRILRNQETYAAGNAILIYSNAKVNGSISNNVMDKTNLATITLSTSAIVTGNVSGNTINGSEKSGIYVYNYSKIQGKITKNRIKQVGDHGIFVYRGGSAKSGIVANVIETPAEKGIFVCGEGAQAEVPLISKNVIKIAGDHGIEVYSIKKQVEISKNELLNGYGDGIVVQSNNEKKTITIADNEIKGNRKKTGIRIINGKVIILENAISNTMTAVHTNIGVNGELYEQSIGTGVSTQLQIADVSLEQKNTEITIKSLQSKKKKTVTVKWKKKKKVTGYVVQYSTKKDFSKDVKTEVVKGKKTMVTLKKLKPRKKYYVRICSYTTVNGIKIYSDYGKKKSVIVK